ncbi:hypothetical protein ACIO1C_00930 [Streptomyces sp. NPDC087420]|uniref:hypothetical protein n=1 Tax=Streptomyces sp. NPDC087420 TaxID=3365785 RepID=UPI00383721C1
MGSAAAANLDDTLYLLPTLTWQIVAELVTDYATTDHRPEHLRALSLPVYALDAAWSCHAALVRAAETDDESARLASLLSYYLDGAHSIDLRTPIQALERVLAVLSLDLPAARRLMSHLVLNGEAGPDHGPRSTKSSRPGAGPESPADRHGLLPFQAGEEATPASPGRAGTRTLRPQPQPRWATRKCQWGWRHLVSQS